MHSILKFLVPLLLSTLPASAQTERQLDTHNHGEAQLSVVMDNNQMALVLISPAANLVGFEHVPNNAAEQKQIAQARETLGAYTNLFDLPAEAGCEPIDTMVHWTHDEDENHKEHEEHEEHEEHTSMHSEFEAEFLFSCNNMARIEQIDVKLFEVFPLIESIHVEAVLPSSQFVVDLKPDSNTITVSQ